MTRQAVTRQCGECTLCCELLPVAEINKPASTRCKHQSRTKGCKIYANRPISCRVWSCVWWLNVDVEGMRRPDKTHYVIDPTPDIVKQTNDDTGYSAELPVIQVWCDPKYPEAYKDPALLDFIYRRAEEGMGTLVRFNSYDSVFVAAPPLSDDHQWHYVTSVNNPNMTNPFISKEEHDAAKRLATEYGK